MDYFYSKRYLLICWINFAAISLGKILSKGGENRKIFEIINETIMFYSQQNI